jgi:ring-1,2-phenylacetyl-CoA epoxidase subunit PaaE
MLDRETCDEVLGAFVPDADEVDAFFICGPGPMMDSAEAALLGKGVSPERIHMERFTAGRPSAALAAEMAQLQEQASGLQMSVTIDGRTRKIAFDGSNILDSARASGLPAPFACKAGVCATCRARVIGGEVSMAARYGLTDEEIAAGYVLTCQAVPKGEGVALDYDA